MIIFGRVREPHLDMVATGVNFDWQLLDWKILRMHGQQPGVMNANV